MQRWEIALNKFMKDWKDKKEVVGALVCGSYITGNPSKHSDVDVHIILDKKCKWRERGNRIIDGVLIEYFANPVPQIHKYFENDLKVRKRIEIHMFLTGKVLFDKTGEVKRLVQMAKKFSKKSFKKITHNQMRSQQYLLWDKQDNLEEVYEANKEDFHFTYFVCLNELFNTYAQFHGFEYVLPHKMHRFLTDSASKKKYQVKDFPDKKFVTMFVSAMKLTDKKKMMQKYQNLTSYVNKKMGGFKVAEFTLRTPVELK